MSNVWTVPLNSVSHHSLWECVYTVWWQELPYLPLLCRPVWVLLRTEGLWWHSDVWPRPLTSETGSDPQLQSVVLFGRRRGLYSRLLWLARCDWSMWCLKPGDVCTGLLRLKHRFCVAVVIIEDIGGGAFVQVSIWTWRTETQQDWWDEWMNIWWTFVVCLC